jgi:putative transposase
MKFRIIEDQRKMFPVRFLCDVTGVSPAGYYAWRSRPESPRKAANRALLAEIRRLHLAHRGRYGAPRMHVALCGLGHTASRGRADHMLAELTIAAPAMAIQRQKPLPGLIHHFDSGSQCAAADYRKVLNAAGMIQSMSRKGNCWDNAPTKSCFGTIKTALVHQAFYSTKDAARHDLFVYIGGYYNRQRLRSALGYITPERAERQAA